MARPAGERVAAASRGILAYFTHHPTAANLLMLLLVLAGLVTAPLMRTQFMPDIVFEELNVKIDWPGAGPEEVDAAIIAPLLPTLQAVEGVAETEGTARADYGVIELDFEPGWDMTRAFSDVRSALDGAADLPADAEAPEITRRTWRNRVTAIVITGPVGIDQLARIADTYNAALFASGATRTQIRGIADPEVAVEVPSAALIRHDLTLREIADTIGAAAATDPAGNVESANARLKSGAERRTAEAVADLPLRTRADGSVLRVGDVARVTDGGVDREVAYFVGDQPAISLQLERSASGDALALQQTAREVAAALLPQLPAGVRIELVNTRAEAISDRLSLLYTNAAMGLALVLGLLFLFLNARTAIWVAAGIPVALLTAIAVMWAGGLTLNMISLFGLLITLGIIVDDAIVVGEHADYRARRLGEPPAQAAERAARRMALPVLSAAITTIIAFWALTLVGGRYGELIRDIPIVVVAVLVASLIECFLILPHHMSRALHTLANDAWYDWPSRQVNRGLDWVRRCVVRPGTRLVITARYPVLALAVLLLASQAALVISGGVQWRFFDAPERGSITVDFVMVPGATRADTDAQRREIQRALDAIAAGLEAETGVYPIAYALAQTGGNAGRGLASAENREADLKGGLSVELVGADARPYTATEVTRRLRSEVQQLPLTQELTFRSWRAGAGGDDIDVQLSGAEPRQLKIAAEALKRELGRYPEISALSDSIAWDRRELLLEPTPQARQLGFTSEELGRLLRERLDGIEAATFAAGPRTGRIRVQVPDAEQTADFLQRILLRAPDDGAYVPLADLVSVTEVPGLGQIKRENGRRVHSVIADLAQGDPERAMAVRETLREDILPRIAAEYQVDYDFAGLIATERRFLSEAGAGTALCLAGIFLVLAWIFGSWTRPAAIMAVIPFGLIGAVWGHWLWDVPLSMFSVVGLLGMIGIIVNDSIVLITTVDGYAARRGLRPAIVDAVADRLRPVLLTTLTTVLGLAPLLFETSRQAEFLKPTVITLVYGLGFGMLLVLVLVPALLAIGEDVAGSWRSTQRALRRGLATRGWVAGFALALGAWGAATIGDALVTGRTVPARLGWAAVPETIGMAYALFAIGVLAALVTVLTLVGVTGWVRPPSIGGREHGR